MTQQNVNVNKTVDSLVHEGRKIVKKANQRHIIIRKADGIQLADLSMTVFGIVVAGMFFLQPFGSFVAFGLVAYGLYNKVKIEVVHELDADNTVVEVNIPEVEVEVDVEN